MRNGEGRARALLALTMLLLAGGRVAAQSAPSIRISDPAAWAAGSAYAAEAGSMLHIAGVAAAAAGVSSVQVNGVPARLRADPRTPGQVAFERDVLAAPSLREVAVVVRTNAGEVVERRYRVDVVTPGALRQIPELPAIKVPPPPGNPWRPFALRGMVYAVVAGAGAYVATRKTILHDELCTGPAGQQDCVDRTEVRHNSVGPGVGIVGAAAAVALIDAVLTGHRAHARATAAAESLRARTGLLLPALEPDAHGARIALLRLRF